LSARSALFLNFSPPPFLIDVFIFRASGRPDRPKNLMSALLVGAQTLTVGRFWLLSEPKAGSEVSSMEFRNEKVRVVSRRQLLKEPRFVELESDWHSVQEEHVMRELERDEPAFEWPAFLKFDDDEPEP
jgi:hypothetical protein